MVVLLGMRFFPLICRLPEDRNPSSKLYDMRRMQDMHRGAFDSSGDAIGEDSGLN